MKRNRLFMMYMILSILSILFISGCVPIYIRGQWINMDEYVLKPSVTIEGTMVNSCTQEGYNSTTIRNDSLFVITKCENYKEVVYTYYDKVNNRIKIDDK